MAYVPNELTVVLVGCGGTYWTAANYFCALLKRLQPAAIHYVDPDEITKQNTERQWCTNALWEDLRSKVVAAREEFTPSELIPRVESFAGTFQDWTIGLDNKGEDVLVIVNVDNDEARLAVRRWCLERKGRSVMVMSGCDMNYGQVYYGVYEDHGALHDWKPFHPEVGNPEHEPVNQVGPQGCGAQSTLSNHMTGALFGPAILEAMKWWDPDSPCPEQVGEYYWRRDSKLDLTRVWTQKVARIPIIPEVL